MAGIIIVSAAMVLASPAGAAGGEKRKQGRKAKKADSLRVWPGPEIVVTGKRFRSPVEECARSVSVLGRRRVRGSHANSSTDLAGRCPGVFVHRTGRFGRSDVCIRGLGSRGRRSLVLVGGRPETMALYGCTITHSFLLHDVERIEVVRGPSSVLYGSGAIGGVMNIIPRAVGPGLDLEMRGGGGSNGTGVATGRLAWGGERFYAAASADRRVSDGHVEHSGYRGYDVIGRAGALLSPSLRFEIGGKFFDGYKEEPLRSTDDPATIARTWNDYERGSAEASLAGQAGEIDVEARWYRNFGEHRFDDGWHSRDRTDGLAVHLCGRPVDGLEVGGGADLRLLWGESLGAPVGEWEKRDGGIFATAEYRPAAAVILSGGLRLHADQYAGRELCPSAGIVLHAGGSTVFRASVARGFRVPQLNELFMFPVSNPDLEAERVWNVEAGVRRSFGDLLAVDLSVFRMTGDGFVDLAPNPDAPPLFRFDNVGEVFFTGIEASADAQWRGLLSGGLSLSLLDTDGRTRGRPGVTAGAWIAVEHERGTARLEGRRIDEYYAGDDETLPIDAWTVLDLDVGIPVSGGAVFWVGVDNLAGERCDVFVDLPSGQAGLYRMPGRTFVAGLRWSGPGR